MQSQTARNGAQHVSQSQLAMSSQTSEADWTQQYGVSSPYGYLSSQQLSQRYQGLPRSSPTVNELNPSHYFQRASSDQTIHQQELPQQSWLYNAAIPGASVPADQDIMPMDKHPPLSSQMGEVLGSPFDPGLELWPTAPVSFG